METLSDRQLKLLSYVEERYGSEQRQTVERLLSESTMEMIAGLNTAVPMTSYETISNSLLRAGISNPVDRMQIMAYLATLAHGGRIDFRVVQTHKGDYAVRARPKVD